MCLPVGLMRRLSTPVVRSKNGRASPPSTRTIQTLLAPPRDDVKSTDFESGDQTGELSAAPFAVVSGLATRPSGVTSQRFVLFWFAAASQPVRVKTIHAPSGE